MNRHLSVAAAVVAFLFLADPARAQMMPYWDSMGMADTIWRMGAEAERRGLETAWNIARSLPPGYRVPFNMKQWQANIGGYNEAARDYIQAQQRNSIIRSGSVSNWNHNFLGYAAYRDPWTGQGHYLPYTSPTWNVGPFGVATPGPRWDSGSNLFLP